MTAIVPAPEGEPPVPPARRSGEALIQRFHQEPGAIVANFQAILAETQKRRAFDKFCRLAAELVFAYWAAKYGHPKALLDPKREKYILLRLRESKGDVSTLLYALDGGLKDEWVMGTAFHARHKNDGISYIFASRERVEQLAEKCKGYNQDKPHPMVVKHLAGVDVASLVA